MSTGATGSETRLLHVSDTHLGYVAYGDARRAQDFEDAFVEAIDLAIERDVDGVVHTGDLTHGDDPNAELPRRIRGALHDLATAGIPFYFILGNHDIDSTGRPQNWADTIVGDDLGTWLGRQPSLCGDVSLYGLDYHDEDWWEDPDLDFDDPVAKTRPVLCLHQSVTPLVAADYSESALDAIQDRSTVEFDLALLGHSHYTTTHHDADGDLVAHYAGATERTTRGYRDEPIVVTEFTIAETIDYEFHELDVRPFTAFTADYPTSVDPARVRDDLAAFDVAGEVVTLYTSDRTDTALVERAFQDAGAFDARSWPWRGDGSVPPGITNCSDDASAASLDDLGGSTGKPTDGSLVHVGAVRFGRDSDVPAAVPVDQAFEEVVETAIDRAVDAIVVTGPLFVPDPGPEAIDRCRSLLERAAAADVPVLLTPGPESQSSDAVASLRDDGLVTVSSPDGTLVGAFSVHGVPAGSDFATTLLQLTPPPEADHGIVVSQETVSPPAPGADAAWNYTQIRDLVDADVDALLLGSGTGNRVREDRLLAEGAELVPSLDESCFEADTYPGRFSVLTFDDATDSPTVDTHEVSAPPLVRREITVAESASYEDVWAEFATLDVEGAHVRVRLHGADTTIRTRVARELQRDAASVVIWDDEDDAVTADAPTAPGTDRRAVAGRDSTDSTTPQITPDLDLDPPQDPWEPTAGPALVEDGYASITARDDGRCGFVFDVRAWEDAHEDTSSNVDRTSLSRGKWYCHHPTHADRDTCIFHAPSHEVDTTEERSQFLDAIAAAPEKHDLQFYGASLSSLVLAGQELDAVQHYPVDLQHATIGHVRLEDARVHQPLRLDHAALENGVLVEDTRVDADLSLHGASVDGDLRVRFSQFGVRPMLSGVYFDGALLFQQSDLANGLTTSSSRVAGRLKFQNCTVGGHATFYDATFDGSVVINRTNFRMECRFDGARIADDVRLFETTFDQRFDLRRTTTAGELQIRQSSFAGEVDLSNTITHAVAVEDSSFSNTVSVRQSTFDRFAFEHVGVDGTLRFDLAEFGTLRLRTVTCLDHVELVGDSIGDAATPYTVHGDLTVTNGIFHRPLEVNTAGIGGECRFADSVFHDAVALTDATIDGQCSLARTTVEGDLTLDGVLDDGLVLDDATFEGRVAADGITAIDGPVTARRTRFAADLDLSDTEFTDPIDLFDAELRGAAVFDAVVCRDSATFENTTFGGPARFEGVTVDAPLVFEDAVFEADATFVELTVTDADTTFANTRFHGTLALTGAEFDGTVTFADTRVDDRATMVGLAVADALTLTDATFTDTARFEHASFDAGLDADDATFEGAVTFDDATVAIRFDAHGATFGHTASFAGLTTTDDCRATFTQVRAASDVSFHDATFDGRLDVDQATITGALDFTDATVTGACAFTRTTFTEAAHFTNAEFHDELAFDEASASRTVDLSNVTLDGPTATFDLARFDGPVTFEDLTSTAVLSFQDVSLRDRVIFDSATLAADVSFPATAFEGLASFTDCRFRNDVTFRDASFHATARFTDTVFDEGASFQDAHVETPHFVHTRTDVGELDCAGATLGDGRLVQPPDASYTLYNFTNAVLGNLRIRGSDGPADFDAFRLVGTRYDGFQFAEHSGLRSTDACLETYAGTAPTPGAETLETTYLNAKNGAAQVGDSDAAGDFFVQELTHRATTYRDAGNDTDYLKNRTLRTISNYGQSPSRVVLTGLGTVFGFGLVYYAGQLLANDFPAQPGSPYEGLGGSFLLSFEAFTTLVFSGANVTNPVIRFIGAFEGFVGAFTIALFLYALTQSIDR